MNPMTRLALAAIDRYRAAGGGERVFWVVCPLTPSCSAYAREAIARFGVLRGGRLAIARLARCRRGTAPGHDPVPR